MTGKFWLTGVSILFVLATLSACGGGGGGGAAAAPSPNNVPRFAFTANFNDNTVSSYTVNPTTGQLRHNGFVAAGSQPYSVAAHPSGKFVYVTNFGETALSGYAVGSDGRLASLFAPIGCGNCQPRGQPRGVTIDPSGRFLYIAYSNANIVSAYGINVDGTLSFIIDDSSVTNPFSVTIDPAGRFAYITSFNNASVSAFAIQANGSLNSVDTDAGTVGVQASIAAGGGTHAFTIDSTGRFAYAANFNDNTVAAYTVNASTGVLTAVGAPVPVGGFNPRSVSVDPSGKFVYVANYDVANYGSANVSAYSINATTGALTALAGSPFTAGANPGSVTVDPSGKFLYVTNIGSSDTTVFTLDAVTGVPGAARTVAGRNGNQEMAMTRGTAAVVYTPKAAYVANLLSNISQYTVGANGVLSPMTAATVPSVANPTSIGTDLFGRYAYVTSGGSPGSVGQYAIAADGGLGALSPASVALPSGWSSMVAVDPMGRYAYVPNQLDGNVRQYTVGADGTLAIMATATVTAGMQPDSAIVDPTGRFVYVANAASDNISQFTIGATGALTAMFTASVAAVDWPHGMAIHPSGRYLYATNLNAGSVSQYTIGTLGELTSMRAASVLAGAYPMGIAVDPLGRYAYVANRDISSISQYTIGADGALSPMSTPTVTTGVSGPSAIAVDQSGTYVYVANRFGDNVLQFGIGAGGALTPLGTASVPAGTEPVSIVTTATVQ